MAIPNDVEKFLQAVFGSDFETFAYFTNLEPTFHTRNYRQLNPKRDCYWSIAAYPPGYSSTNVEEAALDVRALVIDDVGTKGPSEGAVLLALGEPTAIVETSAGNYQWAYRLAKPVAVNDWGGFFGGVEALIAHTAPLDARSAQTLMRLPMGINTKKGRDNFAVRLVKINRNVELNPDTIVRVQRARPEPPQGTPQVHNIKRMIATYPNDIEYDDWINVGQRIKALAVDEEDGREAWLEFSSRTTLKVYDESYSEWKWTTFTAERTQGGLLLQAVREMGGKAVDDWWQSEARFVFNDGVVPPEVPPGRGRAQFKLGENAVILKTMENAAIGITALGIECSYDEFHHRVWLRRADGAVEKLMDHAMLLLRVELNTAYGRDFGPVHVYDAIMALALHRAFNPVCDMLDEAEKAWKLDGAKRLDRLGPDYFHTEDTKLARACFRKVMIAAVRRARRPGCKFDQILVTESPEGWDKSSAWEVLAGRENFSDADILGKDARQVQEELADVWIHEIADLSGLARAEIERVKAFASRTNDRARPAYGRVLLDQPRQSICVGTTNAEAYLLSTTGNRRFWPFTLLDRVELALLRRDRLLLWGEAAAAESDGETLVLDRVLWDEAGKEQEKRRVIDTWEDELVNLPEERMQDWDGEQFISNLAVQEYLGGYRRQTFNSGSGRKIAEIMRRLEWKKCSRFMDGKAHRGYKRVKPIDVMPSVTYPKFHNPF